MTRHANNLRRGQGEFTLGASAFFARWGTYLRITTASALALGIAMPVVMLKPGEGERLRTYAMAQLQRAFHEGSPIRPTIEVPAYGGPVQMSADRLVAMAAYDGAFRSAKHRSIGGAMFGFVLAFWGCAFWSIYARDKGEVSGQDDVRRGPRVVLPGTLTRRLKPLLKNGWFKLAGISLPADFANRHIALVATTGAGKTTAMREMMDHAERHGDACIIYDTSGEFIAHYYRPGAAT